MEKIAGFILLLLSFSALAATVHLGEVAHAAMEPASLIAKAANAISVIIGVGFILSGYEQYRKYCETPQSIRLSNVLVLIVLGIVLVALPLLANYAEAGDLIK